MSFANWVKRSFYDYPFAVWGLGLGILGPLVVTIAPPLQRRLGYEKPEAAPITYPLPNRPRRPTTGYED